MDKEQYKRIKTQEWKRDREYTDACEACGKQIWNRDVEYSSFKFKKVLCYEHSPLGKVPKSKDPSERVKDMIIASLPDDATEAQMDRVNQLVRSL